MAEIPCGLICHVGWSKGLLKWRRGVSTGFSSLLLIMFQDRGGDVEAREATRWVSMRRYEQLEITSAQKRLQLRQLRQPGSFRRHRFHLLPSSLFLLLPVFKPRLSPEPGGAAQVPPSHHHLQHTCTERPLRCSSGQGPQTIQGGR